MWIKKKFEIQEASSLAGVDYQLLIQWIENEWIAPADAEAMELDDEDIARAKLIQNLKHDFGVNDEGISIVLHLLDQLHYLQHRMRTE